MYVDIGRSLSTGYFLIADQLTREELSYLQRTRDLSTTRYCRSSTALGAVQAATPWLPRSMADGTTGILWRGASAQRTGRPGTISCPLPRAG